MSRGRLLSVNVGRPAALRTSRGRVLHSAIGKQPIAGRVRVEGVNVAGDDQADRVNHGGPDQAVYAYAAEDAAWWSAELGRELAPGMFGENLTLEGVDASGALVGERWRIGSVVLEARQPRIPCAKLAARFGEEAMTRRFGAASRPGAYLAIVTPGELGAGDPVEVLHRPAHGVTMALMSDARLKDHSLAADLLAIEDLLNAAWREHAREWAAVGRPAGG